MLTADSNWLYAQIFFDPSRLPTRTLLLDGVRPLARAFLREELIDRFFYVIYGEGGHHLRLRLRGGPGSIAGPVRQRLEETLASGCWAAALAAEHEPKPWRYIAYLPEYDKYGGPAGMGVSESHFQDSSEIAFAVFEAERDGSLTRAQAALALIDALVSELVSSPAERAGRYDRWRDHWLGFLSETDRAGWQEHFDRKARRARELVLRQLRSAGGAAPGALGRILELWRPKGRAAAGSLRELAASARLRVPMESIAQNYVHMLCNRLDIPIVEEAFLLHLLGDGLTERALPTPIGAAAGVRA